MKFFTHYDHPDDPGRPNLDEYTIEQTGILDTKTQVESFNRAGIALTAMRAEAYGVTEDMSDDEIPILPSASSDLVDLARVAEVARSATETVQAELEKANTEVQAEKQQKIDEALKKAELYDLQNRPTQSE